MIKHFSKDTLYDLNGFRGTLDYLCNALALTPLQVKEQLQVQEKEKKRSRRNAVHTLTLPGGIKIEGTVKELATRLGVPLRDAYRRVQGYQPKVTPTKGNTITVRITFTDMHGKKQHFTVGPTPITRAMKKLTP